jgi:hypothetical protein
MDLLLIGIIAGSVISIPIVILFITWMDRLNSAFLYFDTAETCRLLSKQPRDGDVRITEGKKLKIFSVDRSKPKMLKSFFGHKPLYFLRWNSALPFEFDIKDGKLKKNEILPESLGEIQKSTVIEKLMNPKGATMNMIMFLILGAVIGILAGILIGKFFLGGGSA